MRIAYESTDGGRREIRLVPAAGGHSERLARSPRSRFDLDAQWWTDTGRQVVFSSDRAGGFDLWTATIGEPPERLTAAPGGDFHPTVSPNGSTVAFERARGDDYDLFLLDNDARRERRVTAGAADDAEPTWAPDNRRVAFVSDRGGALDIFVIDTVTGRATNLTRASAGSNTTPAWRPAPSSVPAASSRALRAAAPFSCPASGPFMATDRADHFRGNAVSETICGGRGGDRLAGGAGRDELAGDPGRDRLAGGRGADRLYGGAFYQGKGADRLFGGAGDDRLFASGDGRRDCLWGGRGNDSARLSLAGIAADNHGPAPWGRGRCGDLRTVETLE